MTYRYHLVSRYTDIRIPFPVTEGHRQNLLGIDLRESRLSACSSEVIFSKDLLIPASTIPARCHISFFTYCLRLRQFAVYTVTLIRTNPKSAQ